MRKAWLALLGLLIINAGASAETTALGAPPGGAYLEFPIGRFQESDPPVLFRWKLAHPAHSISLKIYRADEHWNFNTSIDLAGRIDLTAQTETAAWSQERLPIGKYVWAVEVFQAGEPKPVTVDTAQFEIERMQYFDLRTHRIGLLFGFGRGSYVSEDPSYTLSYKVTPTHYGVTYSQPIRDKGVVNTRLVYSDFTLQGRLQSSSQVSVDYLHDVSAVWRRHRIFLGPSLRVLTLPRQRSLDGATISTQDISFVAPGAAIALHKQFDRHLGLYTKLSLELPVTGSAPVKFSPENHFLQVRGGLLYNLLWPIGFAGELFYSQDNATTHDTGVDVTTTQYNYGLLALLLYAF